MIETFVCSSAKSSQVQRWRRAVWAGWSGILVVGDLMREKGEEGALLDWFGVDGLDGKSWRMATVGSIVPRGLPVPPQLLGSSALNIVPFDRCLRVIRSPRKLLLFRFVLSIHHGSQFQLFSVP